MNILEEMSSTSQSNPVIKPSPVTAEHPYIVQCLPPISSPKEMQKREECSYDLKTRLKGAKIRDSEKEGKDRQLRILALTI